MNDYWAWPIPTNIAVESASIAEGAAAVNITGTRYVDGSSEGVLGIIAAGIPQLMRISDSRRLLIYDTLGGASATDTRFTITFSGAGDKYLLGNDALSMTSAPGVVDGLTSEVLEMPNHMAGVFSLPRNRFSDNRKYSQHIQASARGASGPPVRVRWAQNPCRDIHYHSVPGARVFRERAAWDGYPEIARIEANDTNAQFENLWDELSKDSAGAVRYYPRQDAEVLPSAFEAIYLKDGYDSDIDSCLNPRESEFGREFYDIMFKVGVLP